MKLNGTTDFSWFLQSNQDPRVDIKINDNVISCSACFLAAYSPVFYQIIIERDFNKCINTAFRFVESTTCSTIELLDEFSATGQYNTVKECINLLYGGTMEFSFDNIETVIKFSIYFQITDMYHQAYAWTEQSMCIKNFPDLLKCAFSVCHIDVGRRRAELDVEEEVDIEYKDFPYLCEEFVNSCLDKWRIQIRPEGEKPPIVSAFEDILSSEDYDKQKLTNFLLKLKIIRIEHTFPLLLSLLDNDTAESILKKLYEYDDHTNLLLVYYNSDVIERFFKALSEIPESSFKDQKYYVYGKKKSEYRTKKKLEIEKETEEEQEVYRFLSSKTWRSFTLDEIMDLPKKYKLDNFMLAEICWGWLHSNHQTSLKDVLKVWKMVCSFFNDTAPLQFYKRIIKDQFSRDFNLENLEFSDDNDNENSDKQFSLYKESRILPYAGMNAIDTEQLLNNDTKNGMLVTLNDFPPISKPCYQHPLNTKLPYKAVKHYDSPSYFYEISPIESDLCYPNHCSVDDVRRNLPCYVTGLPRCLATVEVTHPDDFNLDEIAKLMRNYFIELKQKDWLRQSVFHWYLVIECGSDFDSVYTPYSHPKRSKKTRKSPKLAKCSHNLTIPCEDTGCPGYKPHYFEMISPIAYDRTEFVQKLSIICKQKNRGRIFVCLLSRTPCSKLPDFNLEITLKDLLARILPVWKRPVDEYNKESNEKNKCGEEDRETDNAGDDDDDYGNYDDDDDEDDDYEDDDDDDYWGPTGVRYYTHF